MNTLPPRVNYEQRVVAVLLATAVNQSTITVGDLAWAINYQRVTRSMNDLLASLRPIFEDHNWPPLTSLVVLKATHEPSSLQHLGTDWRIQQRQCWVWGREQADERQKVRGRQSWTEAIAEGEV